MSESKKQKKLAEKDEDSHEEDDMFCIWDMGSPCDDSKVLRRNVFYNTLGIEMCDKHFEEHKEVVILVGNGYSIEEITEMTPEQRKRLAFTMVLSGMDIDEVPL